MTVPASRPGGASPARSARAPSRPASRAPSHPASRAPSRARILALPLSAGAAFVLCACGSSDSKGGDSPAFTPGTTVTVKGVFQAPDGTGLAERRIAFRNLRRQGYVDTTAVVFDDAARTLGNLVLLAWPFYWFYAAIGAVPRDPELPDRVERQSATPPAYFLDSVLTDTKGAFRFRVDASKLLRDARGGIHVTLVNDRGEKPLFGKFAFLVKGEETDLGPVRLCGPIPRVEEGDKEVTLRWDAFPAAPKKLFATIGDARDNALLWSVELKPGDTSVAIPKTVVGKRKVKAALEAFSVFDAERKVSCLSEPVEFAAANGAASIAAGRPVRAQGVEFLVTTLTNGQVSDQPLFEPFGVRRLSLDLGAPKDISQVVLHNMKLKSSGTGEILVSNDGADWRPAITFPEARFAVLALPPATRARHVRIVTSAPLVDLQEVSLQ